MAAPIHPALDAALFLKGVEDDKRDGLVDQFGVLDIMGVNKIKRRQPDEWLPPLQNAPQNQDLARRPFGEKNPGVADMFEDDNILRVMGMGRPNLFGNINQLYNQMLQGQQYFSNPGSLYQQGMQAAYGIPNQLMNAFGFVNQLNSANMQNLRQQEAKIAQANAEATAQIEAERLRQQGANERVRSVSPLLQGLFSGVGSGLGSVTTNYGAGINPTQGSAAQATDTAGFRSRGAGIKKKQ